MVFAYNPYMDKLVRFSAPQTEYLKAEAARLDIKIMELIRRIMDEHIARAKEMEGKTIDEHIARAKAIESM